MFEPTSRYYRVETASLTTDDGRVIPHKRRRFLPQGETLPLIEVLRQHFQELVPHAEKVVVPGVNHSMQMQDPKLVAAPIAEFLSRHPL